MTVSNEVYRHDYAGNDSTVLFAIGFYFLVDAHIKAILYNSVTEVETVLTLTTHYTLTGAGNINGGELTMIIAPTSDESLTILRNVDLKQETDYVEGASFPAEDHEEAIDKLTMLIQQHQEQLDRVMIQAESYPGNLTLPAPIEDYFLRWASNELVNFDITDLSLYTVSAFMETLLDDTTAAAARATLEALPGRQSYFIDATETDQGLTGNGKTIKAYVDVIGTSKKATLVLTHSSTGNTTTYTLTTSETIPDNITLEIENGAVIDGAGTLTINSPFNPGLSQVFGAGFDAVFGQGCVKEVYPQMWGAVGDGSEDDTAAIQSAIDSMTYQTRVYLPRGEYTVSATLTISKDNTVFEGAGATISVLQRTGDYGSTLKLDINNSQIDDWKLLNFGIENNSAAASTAGAEIEINAGLRGLIRGVKIKGKSFIGILSNGSLHLTIDDVHIIMSGTYAASRYGIKFMKRPDGYGGDPGNNGAVSIINSIVQTWWSIASGDASFRAAIYIESMDGLYVTNTRFGGATIANVIMNAVVATHTISHVAFTNCFFDLVPNRDILTTGDGALSFQGLRLDNNHFGGSSGSVSGIVLQGNLWDVVISNNRLTSWASNCIEISEAVKEVVISGNVFDDYNLEDAADNEAISVEPAWTGDDLIIANNIFSTSVSSGSGIKLQAGSNIIVSGNRIKNNARGIWVLVGVADYIITDNILSDNTTSMLDSGGAVTKTISRNIGYVTENSGSSLITSAATTVVVTHGLAVTPAAENITIIGKENPTNSVGTVWVDTITSTQFTVNVENDPGASNWDFGWRAIVL